MRYHHVLPSATRKPVSLQAICTVWRAPSVGPSLPPALAKSVHVCATPPVVSATVGGGGGVEAPVSGAAAGSGLGPGAPAGAGSSMGWPRCALVGFAQPR